MKRIIIGVVVLAALVVGGVVIYVQVLRDDAPAPLAFSDEDDDSSIIGNGESPANGSGNGNGPGNGADEILDVEDLAGQWQVADDGNEVGYRVIEDFIGGLQNAEAVGRTDEVTGTATFEVDGTEVTLTQAEFAADMASVTSDDERRDNQFRGRIMSTDEFPEARFTLTEPLELGQPPVDGTEVAVTAIGTLELRGVTRDVQADLEARLVDGRIEILGQIPVVFDDYDIPDPSNPLVSTRDNGTLEFLIVLTGAN